MPFYNGQDTILHSLESIYAIGLPEEEWEIIVVDDKSPVTAESVLGDFVSLHGNIRIVRHEVNKRQGGAKNTGIRLAQGQYIAFADQDDVIQTENARVALEFAVAHDVDMLACHYMIRNEDGSLREDGLSKGDKDLMSGKEFCETYFNPGCHLAPWANLYKREFLMRIARPYEEHVVMEDSDWIAWHWIHAERVGIFNQSIYTWVMNSGSITHSTNYINRADWIKFGYRKIRDARLYKELSPVFASIMENDGRQNIIGGMKKLWKVDNYRMFYRHLGDTLPKIQKMDWHGIAKVLICFPILSICLLYPIGSLLKCVNYARHKISK